MSCSGYTGLPPRAGPCITGTVDGISTRVTPSPAPTTSPSANASSSATRLHQAACPPGPVPCALSSRTCPFVPVMPSPPHPQRPVGGERREHPERLRVEAREHLLAEQRQVDASPQLRVDPGL